MFHAPANPVAFLPFVLLGIEWAREGALEQRRRGWVLMAVALALSLYAGFPETAFIDGLLAVLWLLVRLVGMPRRALATYAQSLVLGAVIGALLAAPIIVAFLDYLQHADVGGHGGAFARASLSANSALPAQVMPYVFGPLSGFISQDPPLEGFWGNIGGYLGAALCTLGVMGLAGRRHRALRIVLGAWVVVGLARLVGVAWALDLVNLIPGVKSTAFYRYAPPSWEMAVVVLAVLGLDDVLRRETSRWVVAASGAVMVAIGLLCWHAALPVLHALAGAPDSGAWARSSFAWSMAVVGAVVLLCLVPSFEAGSFRWESARAPVLTTVVLLDVIVMFATPEFSAPRRAVIDTNVVRYLDQYLAEQRFYTLGPLSPNYGSYYALSSLNVNDLPIPKAFENFVTRKLDSNVDPLIFTGTTEVDPNGPSPAQELVDNLAEYQAVGVKYVILPPGFPLPPSRVAGIRQVYADRTADIVEIPHPAPLFGSAGGGCTVRTLSPTQASVDCPKPSTIVYRELSMPGWHAQVDGRPLAVHPHGPIFQSVDVPGGRSTVQFSFTPPYEGLALAAFAAGLVALVLAWPAVRRLSLFSRPRHRARSRHQRFQ
jgi:hypothetical protein